MALRTRPSATEDRSEQQQRLRALVTSVGVRRLFAAESPQYFMILGATLFLVVLGLVMVLSSSSVTSFSASADRSPLAFFGDFLRQSMFAILGLPMMLLASTLPARFWQRVAAPAVIACIVLLGLVAFTSLGSSAGTINKNWLSLGPISLQPSEFLKAALVPWMGLTVAQLQPYMSDWRRVAARVAPVIVVALGLVLYGGDLGTGMILFAIVVGSLFIGGMRLRHLGVALLGVGVIAVAMAYASPSRFARVTGFLTGNVDPLAEGWQSQHGLWALAAGGVFGAGLGNSKAKWSWLPHADNDFIFAIIGEELGLIGAVVVLALFVVLTVGFVRVIRASSDPFVKVATSAALIWLVGQAFVNIAVVLGLLPVLGVPLPLISAGGSALISNLLAIGIVLSFARHQAPRSRSTVA